MGDIIARALAKKLDKIVVNVADFGAKGNFDANTLTGFDDTTAIQAAFQFALDHNIPEVMFEFGKTYKLSNRVFVKQNNLEINFNGATIYWYNLDNIINPNFPVVRDSWLGAIEVTGKMLTETQVNITGYATVVGKSLVNSKVTTKLGKFTVTNASAYAVGDNIYTYITTKPPLNNDYVQGLPSARVHAKIIKIVGNDIFTDYYSPFDCWQFRVFDSGDWLVKLDPVRNVTARNLNFVDLNPQVQLDFNEPVEEDVKRQVSGIVCSFGDGFTLEDYRATGTHYSGFETRGCRNVSVKNYEGHDCKYNGPGKGYGIHFHHSMLITCENVTGQNMRHTIDLSGSSFATIINCMGSGHEEISFTLHGECEHNVTYTNCNGTAKIGHGVLYFSDLDADVKYINCNIHELMLSWCDKATFEQCRVDIWGSAYDGGYNEIHMGSVSFKDSTVRIISKVKFIGETRSIVGYRNRLKFDNCEVYGLPNNDTDKNIIGFDKLEMLTIMDSIWDLTLIPARVSIGNIGKLRVRGNNFNNTYFEYADNTSIVTNDTLAEYNTFDYDDTAAYLPYANMMVIKWYRLNTLGNMVFRRNTFNLKSNTAIFEPLRVYGSGYTGSKINFVNENNTFNLLGSANVSINISEVLNILVTATDPIFNKVGSGNFAFSPTFNMSVTNLKNSVPLTGGNTPPSTVNVPSTGHIFRNSTPKLGEPKSWTYDGTTWVTDAFATQTQTCVAGVGTVYTVSSKTSKRGIFTVNCSFTSAAYCQFVSDGVNITVISKSANVNPGSVIASALNIELVSGDIRITNNLGGDRPVTISSLGF